MRRALFSISPMLSAACRTIAAAIACLGGVIAADRDEARPGDATPRGELSLSVDPIPKRYRIACPDRDGGVTRISGEWDEYLDATLCWRPTLAMPRWVIGLALHVSDARERDLRVIEAGLGFDVGFRLVDSRPSLPLQVTAIGRYSGGALGMLGNVDGVALRRAMESTTADVGIEAGYGGGRGPQARLMLGYQYRLITDVYPRVHLAGIQQGPVVAAIVGWRW